MCGRSEPCAVSSAQCTPLVSPTDAHHTGHAAFMASHLSMQSLWKTWEHGRRRIVSPLRTHGTAANETWV